MSCHTCNHNPCTCDCSCDPESEPLASVINNFQMLLFGAVTKNCVNGVVVWTPPCDLDTGAVDFPKLADEPILCYFLRYLEYLQSITPVGYLLAANNLSDLDDLTTALQNLGLVIGTDVQAWDAQLDVWATKVAPSGVVVGDTDTQTLTNKTVTNPTNTGQTLTDGATINWDMNSGGCAIVTLAGNRTMAAPTNLKRGTYVLEVVQDGVGTRTITWNAVFKWASGTAPVLTTTPGAIDVITFYCNGTTLVGAAVLDAS